MTVSAWITKASKLHRTCVDKQEEGNGSKKNTMSEATTLNELQHEIGSDHAIKQVTYNETRESLDVMFVMVKAGQKTPPLTLG